MMPCHIVKQNKKGGNKRLAVIAKINESGKGESSGDVKIYKKGEREASSDANCAEGENDSLSVIPMMLRGGQ